jgi:hypothetical protein
MYSQPIPIIKKKIKLKKEKLEALTSQLLQNSSDKILCCLCMEFRLVQEN